MENDGKSITAKYVHPNYEIRKVTYVAQESIDEISEAVAKKINELLAAEKKGKWIDYCGGVKCDQCGFECDDTYYLDEANFCPNCGARMRMEE